jgi:hypothetical protein
MVVTVVVTVVVPSAVTVVLWRFSWRVSFAGTGCVGSWTLDDLAPGGRGGSSPGPVFRGAGGDSEPPGGAALTSVDSIGVEDALAGGARGGGGFGTVLEGAFGGELGADVGGEVGAVDSTLPVGVGAVRDRRGLYLGPLAARGLSWLTAFEISSVVAARPRGVPGLAPIVRESQLWPLEHPRVSLPPGLPVGATANARWLVSTKTTSAFQCQGTLQSNPGCSSCQTTYAHILALRKRERESYSGGLLAVLARAGGGRVSCASILYLTEVSE